MKANGVNVPNYTSLDLLYSIALISSFNWTNSYRTTKTRGHSLTRWPFLLSLFLFLPRSSTHPSISTCLTHRLLDTLCMGMTYLSESRTSGSHAYLDFM